MDLADEGEQLRAEGDYPRALTKFRRAVDLEGEAADSIDPTIQPGHGILHRSAATLAIDANLIDEALTFANRGLAASPVPGIELELKRIVELATVREHQDRHIPRPGPLVESVIRGLSGFFQELCVETGEEGRVIHRPSEISSRDGTSFWLYRNAEDFKAWKSWSWIYGAFPPRIRLTIDRNQSIPQVSIEFFAPVDTEPDFFQTMHDAIASSTTPTDMKSQLQQRLAS